MPVRAERFNILTSLIFCVIAMATCGCAATNVEVTHDKTLADRFPSDRFITAIGESTKGRSEAEKAARIGVSEQIDSKIQASFSSIESLSAVTGKADVGSYSVKESKSTTTSFDRAELIRIVPEMARSINGNYTAVAVLDRDEAARAFIQDYKNKTMIFRAGVRRAIDSASDVSTFATPYNAACVDFETLTRLAVQTASVGRSIPEYTNDQAEFKQLLEKREALVKDLIITIHVERTGDEAKQVAATFHQTFKDFGIVARSGDSCTTGLMFMPAYNLECKRGHFGPVCAIAVTAEVRRCMDGGPLAVLDIGKITVPGADTRDMDSARTQAVTKITPDAVGATLRTQLSGIIPLR